MLKDKIVEIEKRELYMSEFDQKVNELKNIIEILEHCKIKVQINFSVGEIGEEQYRRQIEIYDAGIKSLRMEMESLGKGFARKSVRPEKGFHFYEGIGKPTGQIALSLEDFAKKVRMVSIVSLEFHQDRGDFAKWIRDIFDENSLVATIENLKERGENLRRKIAEITERFEQDCNLPCPNCGKEVSPQKTWKMARRKKEGESLQLTLGYYKCPNCGKIFRKVLSKEMV